MVTDRERAAFEAGIKLGALYHQWVGTPVSPATADLLEQAIERSVALQPAVESVRVHLNRSLMSLNSFGYSELGGMMFDVEADNPGRQDPVPRRPQPHQRLSPYEPGGL